MNNLSSVNIFIQHAEEYYDQLVENNRSPYKIQNQIEEVNPYTEMHIGKYKIKLPNIKNTKEEINDIVYLEDNHLDKLLGMLEEPISFILLWQYCQFVRWAEKVVFYENDTDKPICVDSDMNELECRIFALKSYNMQALFKIEMIDNPVYKPNTFTELFKNNKDDIPPYFKSVKLKISRLYGKKLSNTYTILDENLDYEDDSDIYLMKTINHELKIALEASIRDIFDRITEVVTNNKYKSNTRRSEN